ncbi:ATP-binding protein [Novosphingobium sp. Leaf2]|uniref:ATP-binding protein n=1 Tax=Novosphingobium sp. Leaf2 TaxID=1735670 RepID=UPI0006FF10B2|nr:ATP-binding protein [Novosphingobium sp. Leaf2]KQM21326.1 ATP-binding protein [Novosphingobium sp. Leaf2]
MSANIVIGTAPRGEPVEIDIKELLATRLLVQGNSGSGKSHLLRRILEESAGIVQQVVIDPEGDFVSLAEQFGHVVIDGSAYGEAEIARLGARIRQHRASVVLALDELEIDQQMKCAAQFLGALFDAPRDQWYPALVVVDEAQLFAPAAAGEVSEEARRVSLAAMTNLMCRGRKRGLAGVIATQRLAKLAKNVAAEASNFLMGRTFLDIDMIRAADLLGMERRQAEAIRDLARGQFLGLGPAIARRPVAVTIGAVRTGAKSVTPGLAPLPTASTEELRELLHENLHVEPDRPEFPRPAPRTEDAETLARRIAANQLLEPTSAQARERERERERAEPGAEESREAMIAIMNAMAQEDDCTFQSATTLFQDFTIRCRMKGISVRGLDATMFRRGFAAAIAGIENPDDARWEDLLNLAKHVPDDALGPFYVIARAAIEGKPCPDDADLARIYGTSSPRRVQRLLDYLEKDGLIVVRTDFSGKRSVALPDLGVTTAPVEA